MGISQREKWENARRQWKIIPTCKMENHLNSRNFIAKAGIQKPNIVEF
jgi:hypothetical protein